MSCPWPAPKGLVCPQICCTWGDTLSMGPRGCPRGFPVPMGMVGLVVSGRGWGGLVPLALVPRGMQKRAGWWERRKGFPSWRGGCNCTVQIEPVRRPSDSASRGAFAINNK